MIVTYSFFQADGHILVADISLYMSVSGIAKKSLNSVTSEGKISPGTIDFGFLNLLILPATSNFCNIGSDRSSVKGI